jgi:nicotinamide-nucleotide amidase
VADNRSPGTRTTSLSSELDALGTRVGARLKQRGETIAVGESSAGGLISAALLAVPGASAYFVGGSVLYTTFSKEVLLGLSHTTASEPRSSTEPHTLMLARAIRERLGTSWGLAETGAAGPSGNRYGDAAGHACLAYAGSRERSMTVETGESDRLANMDAFARAALELFLEALED